MSSDDDDDAQQQQFEREIAPLSRTLQALARRRRYSQVCADDEHKVESIDAELVVTPAAMERVTVHPDDPAFYPDRYRMWRFHVVMVDPEAGGEEEEDGKPHAIHWKPYFSLTDREKLVVETKLGPKLTKILWTRWPRATVDRFSPAEPAAIV